MVTTHYGITQHALKVSRARLLLRNRELSDDRHGNFSYIMAQLAQTYRTRKAMYDTHDNHPPRIPDNRCVLPE